MMLQARGLRRATIPRRGECHFNIQLRDQDDTTPLGAAVALLQALDELAHVRPQRCEQIVRVLAMVQHQPAEQLRADRERRASRMRIQSSWQLCSNSMAQRPWHCRPSLSTGVTLMR